jgi:hypothetical protein
METNLEMIKKDKNLMEDGFVECLLYLVYSLLFVVALPGF